MATFAALTVLGVDTVLGATGLVVAPDDRFAFFTLAAALDFAGPATGADAGAGADTETLAGTAAATDTSGTDLPSDFAAGLRVAETMDSTPSINDLYSLFGFRRFS
ncbi:MAG TPA: hypothetical protein PLT77_15795 [Burkholderiaceae bacterium]|nr:hypothetical protein [Burkholderiaceae bacterium]